MFVIINKQKHLEKTDSAPFNFFLFFYWQWALVLQWQELSSSLPTTGRNYPNLQS